MADKTALEKIADLNKSIEKLKADALAQLAANFAKQQGVIKTEEDKLASIDAQIVELGGKSLMPSGKRGRKSGGASTGGKAFTSTAKEVAKYIAENAGDEGVSTRSLSAEFGKPSDGWEATLEGAAKVKGKGSSGRWFPM